MSASLFDLAGRAALVTGGNGGIGLGLARGLAKCGAAVMVAGRDAGKNEAAVAELRGLGARAEAGGAAPPRPPPAALSAAGFIPAAEGLTLTTEASL